MNTNVQSLLPLLSPLHNHCLILICTKQCLRVHLKVLQKVLREKNIGKEHRNRINKKKEEKKNIDGGMIEVLDLTGEEIKHDAIILNMSSGQKSS